MTSQYVWDRLANRDPDLRAADADRERAAERLRTSHAEGRLDLSEFQERLERCYEARTMGELDRLLSDLPGQLERSEPGASRRYRRRRGRLGLAPILIALLVVSAAAGHPVFWLLIPLMFLVWTWWHAPSMGNSRSRARSG